MIKRYTIGYVYPESDNCLDDKFLIKVFRKKFNLILFPLEKPLDEKQIEQAKTCRLIFNNAVCEPFTWDGIELSKTFEEFGIKVINPSRSFYYQEDKWVFYLECLKNNIPTPLTYLIPKKLNYNEKKIKKLLMDGPIVIKSVFSDKGLCVERAKTFEEFENKLQKIIDRAPTTPVIAQKYIEHDNTSYKVLLIGNKVVQSVIIKGISWEQTGMKDTENYRSFKPDKKLKKLCEKVSKIFRMRWCSLDLIKQNDDWYLIEVNGCPAVDFIYSDMNRIGNLLVNFLLKEAISK